MNHQRLTGPAAECQPRPTLALRLVQDVRESIRTSLHATYINSSSTYSASSRDPVVTQALSQASCAQEDKFLPSGTL